MVNISKRKKGVQDLKAVESYLPKTSTRDCILAKNKTKDPQSKFECL